MSQTPNAAEPNAPLVATEQGAAQLSRLFHGAPVRVQQIPDGPLVYVVSQDNMTPEQVDRLHTQLSQARDQQGVSSAALAFGTCTDHPEICKNTDLMVRTTAQGMEDLRAHGAAFARELAAMAQPPSRSPIVTLEEQQNATELAHAEIHRGPAEALRTQTPVPAPETRFQALERDVRALNTPQEHRAPDVRHDARVSELSTLGQDVTAAMRDETKSAAVVQALRVDAEVRSADGHAHTRSGEEMTTAALNKMMLAKLSPDTQGQLGELASALKGSGVSAGQQAQTAQAPVVASVAPHRTDAIAI